MNYQNPEIKPHLPVPTDQAIQAGAPDFVETPDPGTPPPAHEALPIWLFIICGFALFMAGSSFAGFGTFGRGLYDQGPGAPAVASRNDQATAAAASADPMVLGKKTYGSYCASCHQATGVGQPGKYPPLSGSEWVLGSKERLTAIVLHGLSGPVTVKGASYGTDQMAPWASSLSDKQMANILTYVRGSWGNTADPVAVDEVTAARTKFTSQSAPYSEADLLKIAPHDSDTGAKK